MAGGEQGVAFPFTNSERLIWTMHLGIAIDVIFGYLWHYQLYGHANVAERIAAASCSRALNRITVL